MTLTELRTDVVILACTVSAGIHAALVPGHFTEGTGAGVGFVVATVLLALLTVVLTRRPSQPALLAAAAVFIGLIASYALACAMSPGAPPGRTRPARPRRRRARTARRHRG